MKGKQEDWRGHNRVNRLIAKIVVQDKKDDGQAGNPGKSFNPTNPSSDKIGDSPLGGEIEEDGS